MEWGTFWTGVAQTLILAVVLAILVALGSSVINTVMRKRKK